MSDTPRKWETEKFEVKTYDHPEANGKKAGAGHVEYLLSFTLDDGRILTVLMGQIGLDAVTGILMDFLTNAPSHDDKSPVPALISDLTALRSSLDAANRALAEEQKRNKQHLIDINWLEERISMDDSGAALVEAQEYLTEVRAQLAAAEKMKCFWPKGCSDSARCKENGSCVAQDQRDGFRMQRTIDAAVKLATPDVESLKAQLTGVRAKLEAAERRVVLLNKERDDGIEKYLSEKACCSGFECGCRGVSRLQQMIHEECGSALTSAASREAALVEAITTVLPAVKFDQTLTPKEEHIHPDYIKLLAALARCSPPAAETET